MSTIHLHQTTTLTPLVEKIDSTFLTLTDFSPRLGSSTGHCETFVLIRPRMHALSVRS
jgi:hypothetical protein